jgi:hypothetical protein
LPGEACVVALPQHVGGQFLGAGLADAAGDADHTQRRVGAVLTAETRRPSAIAWTLSSTM